MRLHKHITWMTDAPWTWPLACASINGLHFVRDARNQIVLEALDEEIGLELAELLNDLYDMRVNRHLHYSLEEALGQKKEKR